MPFMDNKMKLTTRSFGDDYRNQDVGFCGGGRSKKKGIKKMDGKARRGDGKKAVVVELLSGTNKEKVRP